MLVLTIATSGDKSPRQFQWPILLVLIWICMVALTNPVGNFPLSDDWAYAYSVQHLLQHGELRFSDWTATNLLGQVVWGALFCLPCRLFLYGITILHGSSRVGRHPRNLRNSSRAQHVPPDSRDRRANVGVLSNLLRSVADFHERRALCRICDRFPVFFHARIAIGIATNDCCQFCPGWHCDTHTPDWSGPSDSLCLRIAYAKGDSATLSLALLLYRGDWNWSSVRLPGLAFTHRPSAGEFQQANFYNFSQLTNAPAAHAS